MKNNYSKIMILVFFLLLNLNNSYSQFHIKKISSEITNESSLHENTTIVNVKQNDFLINEVVKINKKEFKPLKNENTDLGFTDDNYWLHFQVHNDINDEIQYYIETSRPIVDVATFYKVNDDGTYLVQKSGDLIPFKERSISLRKTVFKINLLPNETGNYYIHLKSDGEVINAPVILRTADNLISEASFEQIIFGFFYGILIMATILYFFFFFAMKEKVFLYYSLYVLFIGLLQFSLDGYFYQFITPNSGWLSNKSVLIFAIISGVFLGKYAQTFLKVEKICKSLNFCYNLLYVFFACLMVVVLFVPNLFKYGYPIMNALGLFLLVLIISSLVVLYKTTGEIYQFFALGILSLVTGFVIFIMKNFSLLPYNFITENSSKLGTGLEVVFLSLSMASLIKKLKEDKEKLQTIALQKSEEMNEMKSYFLSNISHELRTPLNTIMNFIESIDSETDSKSIQEKCEIIKSSSSSLLSSVNDILDFSKIEKDEIKLEEAEFNFHELVLEIKSEIGLRAKNKNLDFQFFETNELPKLIYGDSQRMKQIMMNLLCNALKFTNYGIVKFKIESKTEKGKVNLKFTVSDTGEGIAKEKIDSIFDSFSQQSIDNKRKYGGLGLGLYIVKALVDLHKGSIDIQSIVDQGTTCTVKISAGEVVQKEETINIENKEYNLNGKKILVVEDNAMNQMVLKMITKKWLNTEVDYAFNGEEALHLMNTIKYDIVLMDLQMPVMDGYEATIEIRKGNSGLNDKNIPIIAVTADVMETTKDRVKEIGMNYYLSKPINKDILFETIQKCA